MPEGRLLYRQVHYHCAMDPQNGFCGELVDPVRIERTTSGFSGQHSYQTELQVQWLPRLGSNQ